jgi:putative intracellular protease/amidase
MPLPQRDFDPTEVAVPWAILTAAGHRVVFATPDGQPAQADRLMLTGEGLDAWGWIPGLRRLRLIGLVLRADRRARAAHTRLTEAPAFRQPLSYDAAAARSASFAGLLLPGGHRARGMRAYLEDVRVQSLAADFFRRDAPVAAICHGVLVLARAQRADGRSVLHGRRTTALTWALEKKAWDTTRWFARFWDRNYYRTYPDRPGFPMGDMGVQAEVTRALATPGDFVDIGADTPQAWRKRSGLFRDRPGDDRAAFVVRDRNYLSARWPGDAHAFARAFVVLLADTRNA